MFTQTVGDKTVISGLRQYTSDRYGLQITVGGVGGDFSQTVLSSYSYSVLVHFTAASSACVHFMFIQYSVPLLSQLQFPVNEMV